MNANSSTIFHCCLSVIVATLLFLPTTAGWTGTFTDDFNDGNADGWTIVENAASEWKVINGGYHGSIADGTESIALTGEVDWDVESIEVKIRDVQGEWLALIWRYQDLNNFDSWWFNIAGGALEAWPKVSAYEGAARASGAVPFDPAKEFTFKVVIKGNDFDAFFDGQKIGTYTNDAFAAGQVGFLVWAGSATFDDVVITGPNISGAAAVSASGKITTVWGKLKAQ
ncbi:hypothetical protein FJZ31_28210 [Candidatus Poribacteria bacterium]|nr:hypothetical protein [Candidatus Poribacteria bacterium]